MSYEDKNLARTASTRVTPDPDATAGKNEPVRLPRMWAMHCPFRKTGSPVLGSFGASIEPVVIMKMSTWTQLCKDVPQLQTTQFEVGTVGE
jgi:hypothetical protein